MGYHFTQEYLSCSRNEVGEQCLVFCESSFWSVYGADSIWAIAFCWHSTKESLQYEDNHVARGLWDLFWSVDGADSIWVIAFCWHSAQESLQYEDNHVDEQCVVVCKIHFGALIGQIQSGPLLFADTLLKNLCNMKTIMWMNSASWFVRFILEHWWGRFNLCHCFLLTLCSRISAIWRQSCGRTVPRGLWDSFWSVDGTDSIWAIAFCWHSAQESLQYEDNNVDEQCLVVCEIHFGALMGQI